MQTYLGLLVDVSNVPIITGNKLTQFVQETAIYKSLQAGIYGQLLNKVLMCYI